MKIVLISKYAKTGGAAIAAYRLMTALRGHGVDASMLVQDGRFEEEGVHSTTAGAVKRWINMARFIAERLVFLRHERSGSIRFLFSLANTGEDITRNRHVREADIIHLHWINAGYLSLKSLKRLLDSGKPIVWTFHDMWAFTGGCHYALECLGYRSECGLCLYLKKPGRRDLSHRLWMKKRKLFLNSHVTAVAPSNWLKECMRSSSLLRHWEVRTIHNPVDQVQFRPLNREHSCRNLGLDPDKRYILFGAAAIGNMLKGFDYFVEAIGLLVAEPDPIAGVEILLFGKKKKGMDQLLPLKTNHIRSAGSVQVMAQLYNVAHLFVIPSLQDNLPNTIIESMLCGTPVVGFSTGGIPEMIGHKKDGYLAEPRSARDLAAGMKWLLTHPDHRSVSLQAREAALDRFSSEKSVAGYLEIYRDLMKQKGDS
jgi:glycosyltransferase involved in cell wall biosynthesis